MQTTFNKTLTMYLTQCESFTFIFYVGKPLIYLYYRFLFLRCLGTGNLLILQVCSLLLYGGKARARTIVCVINGWL